MLPLHTFTSLAAAGSGTYHCIVQPRGRQGSTPLAHVRSDRWTNLMAKAASGVDAPSGMIVAKTLTDHRHVGYPGPQQLDDGRWRRRTNGANAQ
jgi:hypothetical protein